MDRKERHAKVRKVLLSVSRDEKRKGGRKERKREKKRRRRERVGRKKKCRKKKTLTYGSYALLMSYVVM